jgi:hypothetical protein
MKLIIKDILYFIGMAIVSAILGSICQEINNEYIREMKSTGGVILAKDIIWSKYTDVIVSICIFVMGICYKDKIFKK